MRNGLRASPQAVSVEARGIEPLTTKPEGIEPQDLGETGLNPLAYPLARQSQIDPALARIIDPWPTLPDPIRRAMLALVESGK